MAKTPSILTLDFDEANIAPNTIRFFKDYGERRFLIGYCRREKKQWIMTNRKYPVRVESAKRVGVDINDSNVFAVDYVVLHYIRTGGKCQIFKAIAATVYSKQQMKDTAYPNPQSDYLVFELGEEVKFEDINIKAIVEAETKEEQGKPIYLSGRTISGCYLKKRPLRVGLVDADLLCNGTRHPNLALLKIAGYLRDNHIKYELIINPDADIAKYRHIFMSRVFTFTEEPAFYTQATLSERKRFHIGGTGYYANEKSISKFKEMRDSDMECLSHDSFLNTLVNAHNGQHGIDMATQMPDYHLYDSFVDKKIKEGFNRDKYKDYLNFSIGFLTRKCYRHCPFCVNKLEDGVTPYSKLEWFHDHSRSHVYFWDDNFLAAPYDVWKPALQHLIDNKISFQFRQGLDERQLVENEYGEEMAQMLAQSRYYGDFIFAFDNWKDRDIIEKSLKIWKRYNPTKGTKFYLFCGFMQTLDNKEKFYRDIWEIFQRIKILMQYGCVGYVMRHEDYHKAPIANIYVQIARWCNQQAFYKKMSFWEYTYRNQTFWEEQVGFKVAKKLKTFAAFEKDLQQGYYGKADKRDKIRSITRPLQTFLDVLDMFPEHREELLEMANYKMEKLKNPALWK